MAGPNLRQITDKWHDLGPFRACAHWVEFDAPIVEGVAQTVPLQRPDGTTVAGVAATDALGAPVPTRLRSYIGVVLEQGGVQLQVRARLRVGYGQLELELAEFG